MDTNGSVPRLLKLYRLKIKLLLNAMCGEKCMNNFFLGPSSKPVGHLRDLPLTKGRFSSLVEGMLSAEGVHAGEVSRMYFLAHLLYLRNAGNLTRCRGNLVASATRRET